MNTQACLNRLSPHLGGFANDQRCESIKHTYIHIIYIYIYTHTHKYIHTYMIKQAISPYLGGRANGQRCDTIKLTYIHIIYIHTYIHTYTCLNRLSLPTSEGSQTAKDVSRSNLHTYILYIYTYTYIYMLKQAISPPLRARRRPKT